MRGVILDAGSLGTDVDLAPVLSIPGEWQCHGATSAAQAAARIGDAEVVLANKVPLTAQALAAAPRLRLVVVMATGTDNVDLAAASAQGVAVCNVRGYATASVAEHTMLLLLALARSLLPAERSARDGSWSRSAYFCVLGHPAVANVAVVPKPDAERGAVVKAFIVLSEGQRGDAALVEELQRHVRGKLAPYEYPKEIEFIESLPMTTTGKVQRRVLRELEAGRADGTA